MNAILMIYIVINLILTIILYQYETYKKLQKKVGYLNLQEKLLKNKEKFIIFGNTVSFIFSTSEIEKNDLYSIYNDSSII